MKIFKTEKKTYFNVKQISNVEKNKIISKPKKNYIDKSFCYKEDSSENFLNKKLKPLHKDKYDNCHRAKSKGKNEGRWTLKEHIQFLQAVEQFGSNWRKLSDVIRTRTPAQIISHSQKFFKKLKNCKDTELGIDFTLENINNINDMIAHIKSVSKDFNLVNLLLYLSEKCKQNKNSNKKNKAYIDINNILCENIGKNLFNDNEINLKDEKNVNIFDKEVNKIKPIINVNLNNSPNNNFNNIFINNINFFNGINILDLLYQANLNNAINSNFISSILLQNNIYSFNNNSSNDNTINLLNKNNIFNHPMNSFEANNIKNINDGL